MHTGNGLVFLEFRMCFKFRLCCQFGSGCGWCGFQLSANYKCECEYDCGILHPVYRRIMITVERDSMRYLNSN